MRVLVAMSGGVDSSVAAALLVAEGHEVVGATLKLWGGAQDSGCCSVGDVDDARRVAQQVGIAHHVFNFGDDFERAVVAPYVEAHRSGQTPNPCVECNRHLKFDRLLDRALALGFDAVATGHHAQVRARASCGPWQLLRGADPAKDQSYVLHMLGQSQLARVVLPVGHLTKAEVRAVASRLALRTATKPDSQDTCFITASGGRRGFLSARGALRPAVVTDAESGAPLGEIEGGELVTIGQRRGLGTGGGPRRFVLSVEPQLGRVMVGPERLLQRDHVEVHRWSWVDGPPPEGPVLVQSSAHGSVQPGRFEGDRVAYDAPRRAVAPGQFVVLYATDEPERVLGGGAAR